VFGRIAMSLGKRIVRWLVTLTFLVGGGVAFLAWQGLLPIARGRTPEKPAAAETEKAKPRRVDPIAVTVAEVTGRTVQRKVQVVGTLHGTEEIVVAAKVDGRVLQVLHDVGDVVHPGEVLLEIDPTDLELAVSEATRSMELELTRIGLHDVPGRDFDVGALPSVSRARLLEKNARNKYERSQSLYKRQSISREDLEQTETDYEVAQSNTRQAVLDAESIVATIRQREAFLATAQQKLGDAKIVVPTPSIAQNSGSKVVLASTGSRRKSVPDVEYVVAARMVSEGEMVHDSPSTDLFRLVMDRPLKLRANVPERYVSEIAIGQPVEIDVEAYPTEVFAGVVARVNPTVDRENRTFEIEVRIPNDDRRLRAGSFAKAAVLTREESSVPTIPEEALVRFAGVVKVFVVDGEEAQSVTVDPGMRLLVDENQRKQFWQEVAGELPLGTLIVTSGHSQLADGTPVRVRETASGKDRPPAD